MPHRTRPGERGFATLTTVMLLGIAFAFAVILLDVVLVGRQAGKIHEGEISATQVAEAGIQKALFCLNSTVGTNCGGTSGASYIGETNVDIGTGVFTTTVAGTGSSRTVTSVGTADSGGKRTVVVELTTLPPDDEISFSYALQAGEGGVHMENNSTIAGTLYANGNVDCQTTQATVDGDIYVAKTGGSVSSCRANYHAHADKILNSSVGGDAYYINDPADISGTAVTGTKYPGSSTPAVATLPTVNLAFWHDSAEAGGVIYGEYHPADNSTLGPVKIDGNLVMDNNVDIVIAGPVWVEGNITTGNNSSFTLDPAFGAGSTMILADDPDDIVNKGYINITNNTSIYGSGDSRSHILFVTTNSSLSDTVPALSVANNASGAVFFALNGTMRLQALGGAKSLAAKRLFIDQNAVVTYIESELSDLNFSNSPGGKWRILEGTWREMK